MKRSPYPTDYKDVTEKQFTEQVRDLAKIFGYEYYHTWTSMHSPKGWPDVALCKDGRLILAELKREGKSPSPEQQKWLDLLSMVKGIQVYVWRPSNIDRIAEILRGDYEQVQGTIPFKI